MSASPIRAVAFDYSGVMTRNPLVDLGPLEAELGCAPGTFAAEFRGGELFSLCEVGRLAVAEFFPRWRQKLVDAHGRDFSMDPILEIFRRGGQMNPETLGLIARLDPALRLAVVTNNVAETRERWRRKVPIERFAVVIDSSEVGLRKPDPAIYELLLERLGLPGSEVAYVDDWEDNLAPAAALGMRTVLFTTAAACEEVLAALGVAIAPSPLPPWGEVARSAGEGEHRHGRELCPSLAPAAPPGMLLAGSERALPEGQSRTARRS